MKHLICRVTGVVLLLLVSGCVTVKNIDLSDDALKGTGVMLANFASSEVTHGNYKFAAASANIRDEANNTLYVGQVREDMLVAPLVPGKYELEVIKVYQGDVTYTYPIMRKFEIRENQVTNLGVVTFFYKKGSRQYLLVNIDNHDDALGFLKAKYPAIYAAVNKQKFLEPEKGYLEKGVVDKVKASLILDRVGKTTNRNFGSTIAGTVARLSDVKDGKKDIKLLDIGTNNSFSSCAESGQRYVCLGRNAKYEPTLFMFDGKKMSQMAAPINNTNATVYLAGKSSIIMTDEYFVIHVSEDNGKSWIANDKYKGESPVPKFFGQPLKHTYTHGVDGIYIGDVSGIGENKNRVIQWQRGNKFNAYALPDEGKYIYPIETKTVLYSGPYSPAKGPYMPDIKVSLAYSMKKDENVWAKEEIPSDDCSSMFVLDASNELVGASCAEGIFVGKAGMKWRLANEKELDQYKSRTSKEVAYRD